MSTLLKDIYSPAFYRLFSGVAETVIPGFDKRAFSRAIFDREWENRELKQRMKHTSLVLHRFLPADFRQAAEKIRDLVSALRESDIREKSLEFMFLPDYIETYGINDLDISARAFEFLTPFTSCEFAVRPFIIRYEEQMLRRMLVWSLHENHHVRRLASEGSRPRLPWAMALPGLRKDPRPVLPILENLKNDVSDYVRRSVANNLNDISKDHPRLVISLSRKWKGGSKETDAIIRHACRTLLKQGETNTLKLFGLHGSAALDLSGFRLLTPTVKVPRALEFSFTVQNKSSKARKLRLEYAIYYLRQNGRLSKKVFKISERVFQPGERAEIRRKQSFKIITTRRFYPGGHQLSIIINGEERVKSDFRLTV